MRWGKGNPAVKLGTLVTMLERKVGTKKLPEGSIVFATTNLGAEGVGDIIPPHARNRMSVVTMRKSDATEWIDYGINNNFHPSVLGFVREFPQVMQGFEDVKNPELTTRTSTTPSINAPPLLPHAHWKLRVIGFTNVST